MNRHNDSPDRPRSPLPAAGEYRGGGGGGRGRDSLSKRLGPSRGTTAASARGAVCRHVPRLGALAVAALAIALAASASASTAAWQDNGVLPHLPAAYADPHYQPCIFQPHGSSDGSQHTVLYRFVSPDDTYGIGETITIRSDRVQGHGTGGGHQHSRLALETGDVDRFAVHSRTVNSNHLEYVYTVQPGDYSDDLDYRSSNAAHWRDPGTGGNHFANCWLSSPGTNDYDPILTDQQNGLGDKSLSVDRTVRVDGIIPRVEGVTTASGAYGAGSQANVTVNFGEPVFASVPPPSLVLALEKGGNRTIPYLDGNETSSLVFNYTVRPGDLSDDLDYAGTGSLVLAVNGSLVDVAGNNASLALPEPGSPGSLGATSNASITAARGEAAGVDSPLPDGTYPAGHRIEVVVSFNEPVVYSGAPRRWTSTWTAQAGRHRTRRATTRGSSPSTTRCSRAMRMQTDWTTRGRTRCSRDPA